MNSANISDLFYAFRDIAGVVHSSTDPREVSQLVVWKITELLGAKGAILRVINLATDEMELYAPTASARNTWPRVMSPATR